LLAVHDRAKESTQLPWCQVPLREGGAIDHESALTHVARKTQNRTLEQLLALMS
jgi:hypothetical protein